MVDDAGEVVGVGGDGLGQGELGAFAGERSCNADWPGPVNSLTLRLNISARTESPAAVRPMDGLPAFLKGASLPSAL